MRRLVIVLVAATFVLATSAGASYTAEVGYITPSDYEGVENLGENLTDAVASFDQADFFEVDQVGPLTGNQVEEQEVALMYRRWGRLTRRFKAAYRKINN